MYPNVCKALVIKRDERTGARETYIIGDYIEVLDNRGVWHCGKIFRIKNDAIEITTASGNRVYLNFKYIDQIGG